MGMTRPRRSTILHTLAVVLVAAGGIGLAVQLTLRDASPLSSGVFYALPLPLVSAVLLAAGLVWLGTRRRRAALGCAAVALLTAALWARGAYHAHDCGPGDDGVRVLMWNTARGLGGWGAIARRVAAFDADIIGLVEAGGSGAERRRFWERFFPGYDVHLHGGGLVILARGHIVDHRTIRLNGSGTCGEAWVEIAGRRVRVLLVDAVVRPFSDRGAMLAEVFDLARSSLGAPTIVMGDFNTPMDSAWFEQARGDFVHAFEQAGDGLLVTWPVPLPVLAIDHVWVSRTTKVVCAHLGWTWASDHRPVLAQVSLGD
jgi:endonuclease/exonuclease/phosphatase family metal-dependent hydrolase